MNESSGFLYARPSFAEGASRILDFADTLSEYNKSITPEQADYFALRGDWRLVGADILGAWRQDTECRVD